MPELSVIICTRNRLDYLRKALASLQEQTISASEFEIVVVDNGSHDGTAEYIQQLKEQHVPITYVFEPKLGLSHARNTGSMVASGKYLAFLDDDAIAARQWVQNICDLFSTGGNEIGCAGGKIDLIWETSRPAWLHDGLLIQLGNLDIAEHRIVLSPDQYLFGGNFAICKQVLKDAGFFDPHFGRQGNKLISNEEIELQNRLILLGISRVYDPEIVVHHHAKAECVSKRWYVRRCFWQGVSETLQRFRFSGMTGECFKLFASIGSTTVRQMVHVMVSRPDFNSYLQLSYNVGRLSGFVTSLKNTRNN